MQSLDSRVRDHNHLAGLHASFAIARDNVWLDHHGLARAKRLLWHGAGRAALTAKNWRQIATTIAVQKIVDDGEAGLPRSRLTPR